ncbi:unnamed protein product [Candidula unifasciata]|uniref:WAPL domain-containing protein n=1 Tax=Candidula unifasciata TaxID=100452 RepID=A0A8S3Z0G3_9EUPU|nr:unnamed protein product [Candidula unifasciata]
MNEDEIPPARFTGRTYSRLRNSSSNRNVDDAADARTVQVKAAMSLSKWGKANYIPVRDSDGATEPKKMKLESKGEDPFSFETEDKRKSGSAVKQDVTQQEQDPHQMTKLPASRISVKGEGCEEYLQEEKEEEVSSPAFRTYSRSASKKPIIMDQFVEVGKQMPSGQTVFFSEARLEASTDTQKRGEDEEDDEDDDFFPVQFKRDPLKTYSGEVVTPVDKPDSPPQRKSGYKRKGGPRGRKPLTVSDPELIEQYKRNYAAQQLKEKPDAATKGMNNSTVVFKKELANEAQGTTVVVVCKPKAQVDVHAKYISRNSKQKGPLVPVASDATGSQATPGENGNAESTSQTSANTETVSTRTSARLRNVSALAANSEGTIPSSDGSAGTPSSVNPSSTKRATRGRHSNTSLADPGTSSSPAAASSEGTPAGDTSSGRGGKRYRIFKSRTPQMEEELKPPIYKDDLELTQAPASSSEETEANSDNQVSLLDNDQTVIEQLDVTVEAVAESLAETAEIEVSKTLELSELSSNAELEEDGSNIKNNEPAAARDQLAARLRTVEKGNETDSTGEPDNASECSEHLTSQDSLSNSQGVSEDSSQKEGLMMAPRKFFKSKKSLSGSSDLQRKIFGNSPQKSPAKATYNARSWYNQHEPDGDQEVASQKTAMKENDDGIVLLKDSGKGPKLKREVHWPTRQYDEAYTSLKVNKYHKELYTVVHNVKQTHEVQELGETQDFMDEVDYLLDSLQDTNPTPIRCLSCLKLAGKCISPAFRMHIRAHGTVTKIFSLLHDACSDPCLALSTSAMMFMLSRDRLNMDLDQDSLNLMLRLNEVDAADRGSLDASALKELEKVKQKVMELLAQLQQETHAREIDLGFVSTGNLAMESLLSLTSRRAGEWFKEELRSAGGLDYIVDSVTVCEHSLPEDISQDIHKSLPVLKKLDRCLRVLENISSMNPDNQNYLISYKNAALLQACTRTLRLCQTCMPSYKMLENVEENKALKDLPGYTILTCMLAVLRVLLNVTHENQLGNLDLEVETSLMETIVRCLTTTHWCVPMEQRFDLAVLCLGLLINLVEHRESNRQVMMILQTDVKYTEKSQPKTMSAIKAVVELFVQREEAARQMEEDTLGTPDTAAAAAESPNKSGEWKETEAGIEWITNNLKKAKEEEEKQKKATKGGETSEVDEGNQSILEDDEETFTKALHKAGRHMENSIVASYAGLLLGSTIVDNKEYATVVKKLIPNEDFGPMIKMLKKFLNFMSLTTAFGSTDVNGITKVIDVLETA